MQNRLSLTNKETKQKTNIKMYYEFYLSKKKKITETNEMKIRTIYTYIYKIFAAPVPSFDRYTIFLTRASKID